jgi:hypothetical protein
MPEDIEAVKSAILASVPTDERGMSVSDLYQALAPNYPGSQVSAAFMALVHERRIELTRDRRVKQREQAPAR